MQIPRIRTGLAVVFVAAIVIPASSPAQDPQAKAAQILADARKALGGEDRLRAVKTLQASGSFRRMAGNNTLEGDVEVQIQLPDKYRRNESTGNAGGVVVDRTEALDGAEAWDETSGGFPRGGGGFGGGGRGGFGGGGGGDRGGGGGGGGDRGPGGGGGGQGAAGAGGRGQIDPARLLELQRQMRLADFSRLMIGWLLVTDAPVTWVGTAESPEGNADVLEIKPAEGDATRLFLDASTHMPLMITWQGPPIRAPQAGRGGRGGGRGNANANGNGNANPGADQAQAPAPGPRPNATFAMHLSDYKAVNGIKLPFTMTRSLNDQTLEDITIKSYKVNPSFKGNTFTKPKA